MAKGEVIELLKRYILLLNSNGISVYKAFLFGSYNSFRHSTARHQRLRPRIHRLQTKNDTQQNIQRLPNTCLLLRELCYSLTRRTYGTTTALP